VERAATGKGEILERAVFLLHLRHTQKVAVGSLDELKVVNRKTSVESDVYKCPELVLIDGENPNPPRCIPPGVKMAGGRLLGVSTVLGYSSCKILELDLDP
jgi:hypothetical protein